MSLISPFWILDAILIFFSAFVAAYFYMTRNFGHWKDKGVIEVPPTPFVGNFGSCLLFRLSVFNYLKGLYEKNESAPYIGFYVFDKPALLIRDPEMMKNVLVKDFKSFRDRYAASSEADVIGHNSLFLIRNPIWKSLRNKLTCTFSSGKMKGMYPLIDAVGDELIDHFDALGMQGDGRVIDLKDICSGYTTDSIATCAFGLQVNSLKDPKAAFRTAGRISYEFTYKRGFETMSHFFIPSLAKFFRFKFYEANSSKFLRKAFLETLNERCKSGAKRNDLIDLLIELKNSQKASTDSGEFVFDDDKLVAQAAIFFAAGFETSAALISFTLYELSFQPQLQTKLRKEITTALEKNGGKLSYDALHSLPFLEQIVSETLRKYPPLSFLDREAHSDYTIPKTGLVIEKGTPVYISLLGLHYDPKYYPNPEIYDPERFNEENKRQRPPFVYMPFGDGPRNCIGIRFGLMQSKICLVKILANFEVAPCEETLSPMNFEVKSFLLKANGGLHLLVRRIQSTGN